jgi:FemAB-related protein (PEP-CTERM system-associated)
MTVTVTPLDPAREAAWDAFVDRMPDATFFHRAGWARVIAGAFGHRLHYAIAERDGAVTGVLPLVHVRTRLFGSTLVSNPFCVYGGPVAADAESEAALVAHAERVMERAGVSALEFRAREAKPGCDWPVKSDLYVTFRRAIEADDEANMKAIPRKQRAMVRKGISNGLTSVSDHDVDRLHRIYAESVRNLGTPVFGRRYFRLLAEVFRDECDVVTVMDGDEPLASVLNFYFRDQVLPYYGGGTTRARDRAANDFMYWEVIRRAAARGMRLFDFGRSKVGTGAFSFKKNWGFAPEPLHYRYKLKPGTAIPEHNPLNPKYALMIKTWKRLPIPVANLIGPHIVRGIG